MYSVCRCSLPVWRRSFLKKGTPSDLFWPRPGSAPGGIWPKNNNTCKEPWVLHPYQVSSKSIQRFWRRSRKCEKFTDGRRRDGRCAMTIAHSSLRLGWAKKEWQMQNKREYDQIFRKLWSSAPEDYFLKIFLNFIKIKFKPFVVISEIKVTMYFFQYEDVTVELREKEKLVPSMSEVYEKKVKDLTSQLQRSKEELRSTRERARQPTPELLSLQRELSDLKVLVKLYHASWWLWSSLVCGLSNIWPSVDFANCAIIWSHKLNMVFKFFWKTPLSRNLTKICSLSVACYVIYNVKSHFISNFSSNIVYCLNDYIFRAPALKYRRAIAIPRASASASTCKMLRQMLKSLNMLNFNLSVFFLAF